MNVLFVEPAFPGSQRQFVRALRNVGAYVMVVSEYSYDGYDDELKGFVDWHWQVPSVTDVPALEAAVRQAQRHRWVDRLESTIEAHIMPVAIVRERCGIPGTSPAAAWLCRDKPSMKDAFRSAGIPCAASAAIDTFDQARDFVEATGFPVVIKPRAGAGAAGTYRVDSLEQLAQVGAAVGLDRGESVAIEEFIEGHEGFVDTLTVGGEVRHDFVSHYFPNVLEAMRTRWISPVIITTNSLGESQYDEVRAVARKVNAVLHLDTSPTHLEWFFGPKGLKVSEIGARPPGVGHWDLLSEANDMDLYHEWAHTLVYGTSAQQPSRRYSCGVIALRPDTDGHITGYDGLDEVQRRYGDLVTAGHFPPPGTATQGVEAGYHANAWMRLRHPDFDTLRGILTEVGQLVQVRAA